MARRNKISRRKAHSARTMATTRRYCVFIRELLFFAMGGRCANCGTRNQLTMDLKSPDGRKGHHGVMNWRQRTDFYWQEFLKDNLQPLCLGCNSAKRDSNGVPLSLFAEKFSPYNTNAARWERLIAA